MALRWGVDAAEMCPVELLQYLKIVEKLFDNFNKK